MKINKIILLLLALIALVGCATEPEIVYVDRPVQVDVPVIIPTPEPLIIKKPFLPIELLVEKNIVEPSEIAKAYVKSLIILQDYANSLQCALDAYRITTIKQCNIEEKNASN